MGVWVLIDLLLSVSVYVSGIIYLSELCENIPWDIISEIIYFVSNDKVQGYR